jgi:predicted kinase
MASRHLVILLGPPGSGKTCRCRRLRDTGAVVYEEIEPILVKKFGTLKVFASNRARAIEFIEGFLREQLSTATGTVLMESTGHSDHLMLKRLEAEFNVRYVILDTPRSLCVERVRTRERGRNISNDHEAAGLFHDFWTVNTRAEYPHDLAVEGICDRVDALAIKSWIRAPQHS